MLDDEGVPTDPSANESLAGDSDPQGYPRENRDRRDVAGHGSGGTDAEVHLREVVRSIASQLVDEPDAVRVVSRTHHQSVSLSLSVAEGELGKIIGRQGRTARAIRTAVQIAGARHDVRVSLDIEDR